MRGPDPLSAHDLVRRFYERLWNEWDDAAVDDTLAPNITFRGSLGTSTTGRDQWRAYRDQIHCGAPDFHNEILDLVSEAHRAAARLRYSGTHLGPLPGIPQPAASSSTPAPPSSPSQTISSLTSGYSATSTPSADN